ncbi:hypothetical protein [Ponticaulis profundi]|uniref:hypothetical protein n=1 Tax=Ponticaulis profundi TaxID=2665222 RepID=UPI00366A8534
MSDPPSEADMDRLGENLDATEAVVDSEDDTILTPGGKTRYTLAGLYNVWRALTAAVSFTTETAMGDDIANQEVGQWAYTEDTMKFWFKADASNWKELSFSSLVDTDNYVDASITLEKLASAAQDALKSRANHTGTQAISTVSGLQDALSGLEFAVDASTLESLEQAGAPRAVVKDTLYRGGLAYPFFIGDREVGGFDTDGLLKGARANEVFVEDDYLFSEPRALLIGPDDELLFDRDDYGRLDFVRADEEKIIEDGLRENDDLLRPLIGPMGHVLFGIDPVSGRVHGQRIKQDFQDQLNAEGAEPGFTAYNEFMSLENHVMVVSPEASGQVTPAGANYYVDRHLATSWIGRSDVTGSVEVVKGLYKPDSYPTRFAVSSDNVLEINLIVGQSNARASNGLPALTTTPPQPLRAFMFEMTNPSRGPSDTALASGDIDDIQPSYEVDAEGHGTAFMAHYLDALDDADISSPLQIQMNSSKGGESITSMIETAGSGQSNVLYENVEFYFSEIARICKIRGLQPRLSTVRPIHGERDAQDVMTREQYLDYHLQWYWMINRFARKYFYQVDDPLWIVPNLSLIADDGTGEEIIFAQQDFVATSGVNAIMDGPTYWVPFDDQLHRNNVGHRLLAEQAARAAYEHLHNGGWTDLQVASETASASTAVTIPLTGQGGGTVTFDTTTVSAQTNYGVALRNDANGASITSVTTDGTDLTVNFDTAPSSGSQITYALTDLSPVNPGPGAKGNIKATSTDTGHLSGSTLDRWCRAFVVTLQ